jgi:long-chain acyl-CoA synthetase
VWLGSAFRSLDEVRSRAGRLAAVLPGLGAPVGAAVLLLARNSFLPLEATMAVAAAGGQVVPVSPHATDRELAYLQQDSGARIVIGDADLLRPMRSVLSEVVAVAQQTPAEVADAFGIGAADREVPSWCIDYESVAEAEPAISPATARRDATMSSLFYTSGTTGRPKGVLRSAPDQDQSARRPAVLEACYGLTPDSIGLVTTPLCHMFASNFAQTLLRLGGTVVVMPRFDATGFLRLIERHRVTNTIVVPTMLVRLLRMNPGERDGYDVSSLRRVLHTGAPCPARVKRAAIDWFGPVVWEQYGSTETGVVALCSSTEWLAHPGTVGRAFLGSVIRIYAESGEQCPPGVAGQVYARMPSTPDFTYLGRPEARAAVERDGLIWAGDIGELDADGYLYLHDRREDLIVSGGTNVYPAEVEAELATHPEVGDCAVFGVPDEEFGQRAVAVLSLRNGTPGELPDFAAFLRAALAGYEVPREFVVGEVPRNESGKLLRRLARDRHLHQAANQ